MMLKLLNLFVITLVFLSTEALAQSVSANADNMFTEGSGDKPEEIVEGIKDTLSETDNAIEKTVEELEDTMDELKEAEDTIEKAQEDIEKVAKSDAASNPLENVLIMELKSGQVILQLKPELAPNHVARIKELTREGFYNGIVFHRVIDGFMAQTGDPTGTGKGGSGKNLDAEFNDEKHLRGTLSMARAADPNSADSQFFIMFDESPHLDGNYTVFGEVASGMENIDSIKKGFGPNGMVSDPDSIVSLKVAADLEDDKLPESLKNLEADDVEGAEENDLADESELSN